MAVIFGSQTNVAQGSTSSCSLNMNLPAGTVAGDFLIAVVTLRGTESISSSPSDWAFYGNRSAGSSASRPNVYIYTKIATSSEPASYGWTFSAGTYRSGAILRYTGVSATAPVLLSSFADGGSVGSVSFDCPNINTTQENQVVLAIGSVVSTTTPHGFTQPASYTEHVDTGNASRIALGVAERTYPVAGATGPATFTDAVGGAWVSMHLALNDASVVSNQVPVAHAGDDVSVPVSAVVNLDGSLSIDPDGTIQSYSWTQLSGPVVILSGASTISPSFTAPASAATLMFQLTVVDNNGSSANDSVTVSVVSNAAVSVNVWSGTSWVEVSATTWDGSNWA